MAFFKNVGVLWKRMLWIFFEYFHQHSMLDQSMSAYFLTLIPKKSNAVNIKDFHPISLVGSVYKFLS